MIFLRLVLYSLLCTPILLNAQDEEIELIKMTLNDYMIGGTERNPERVASAFHPKAMMKYVGDDVYKEVNAAEFFRKGSSSGPKLDRVCEIAHIDVVGNAAIAKILLKYHDKTFTDFMTLLKIDGVWKIVNKSFHLEKKT